MSKIKVMVNNLDQANEMIEFWKNKGVELEIKVKENTVGVNNDVLYLSDKVTLHNDKLVIKC